MPQQIQNNIVRVDGQQSVYLPVLKQGGDTNTIAVVDGVKTSSRICSMFPKHWSTNVVFDQSQFVKTAIETLLHEGGIGLFLTVVDDPAVSGKLARHRRGLPLHSSLGARYLLVVAGRRHRSTPWCWAGWRSRFPA